MSFHASRPVVAGLPVLLVALMACGDTLAAASGRQALATNRLRVCADPANLPYSNEALEGFENRVVELVADELGLAPSYTWYPQSTGFVRNTLRLRACDLISGITTTSQLVQNTNAYYHSAYAMVYRAADGFDATRIEDVATDESLRFGVVAGTPPADVLARFGALDRVQPYQLVADTRVERPPLQAMADVADGTTDVAFVWGPIAGWYATTHPEDDLVVVPLVDEGPEVRMNYRVSMAVRYNETDWKHDVNRALEARADEIEAVLVEYGVPLLDELGQPKSMPAGEADPALDGDSAVVPEPVGYRTDDYRAPVPPGLRGAMTVAASEVSALLDGGAAVIDVLPAQRAPDPLPEGQAWLPPPHRGIEGALWLPDTGRGALAPITERYFAEHLERATSGDRAHPLVFYCRSDCWMSWNAAKRALAAGWTNVHWYRDGIEDWTSEGMPVATLEPAPGTRLPDEAPGQRP